jgi:hypothetical protein
MCCHYQLARPPAPRSPQQGTLDADAHLREEAVGRAPAAHTERFRTREVIALAMFALWMVGLPWLLAVLTSRRREDRDPSTSRRPGAIRQLVALALAHKHSYGCARDTAKLLAALIRELRGPRSDRRHHPVAAGAGTTR